MFTVLFRLAQAGLGRNKISVDHCVKHWVCVHFYGPRYTACQCAKSAWGHSPVHFPNAIRRIWLHPGQDFQDAQPGHPFAPAGPQGELREALESHLGPGHILALLQPLPSASLLWSCERNGAPWDPIPPSSCAAQSPPFGKGSGLPSHMLYFTGWHLSCPINCTQEGLEMNANFQVPQKRKGWGEENPCQNHLLQESLINAHSRA